MKMKMTLIGLILMVTSGTADAAVYRLTSGSNIIREGDNVLIPDDTRNADYQNYQSWLAAGNVPDPAPSLPIAPPTLVQVNSTSMPALNGSYAFDPVTQSKMLAVSLYISVNGKFPAGQTTFPWADASGAMHGFTSTAQFQSLATALADYATALALGQTPGAPVTIP